MTLPGPFGRNWRSRRTGTAAQQPAGITHAAATVLAAVLLAAAPAGSATARKRSVARAMREVAEYLGNTPTVARNSYVDPRVIDLFHAGTTVNVPAGMEGRAAAEGAVLGSLRV